MDTRTSPPSAAKVSLLTRDRHGGVRLSSPRRFPDSAELSSVPLVVAELAEAAAYFPIAFLGGDKPQLAAILTVTSNDNLFVNPEGTWLDGVYVPALLRRRPFSIAATDKPETYAVLIDETDGTLDPDKGLPLFDGDKLSAFGDELLNLTRELQPAVAITETFVAALHQQGLLTPRTVTLTTDGRSPAVLQGLQLIDSEKFLALPEATVLEWHRNGYLAAIAVINSSQGRWPALLRLSKLRAAARA